MADKESYVMLGSCPPGETVTDSEYVGQVYADCQRYIEVLRARLGPEPRGARLAIRDRRVACYFDDAVGLSYAMLCRDEGPRTWDDVVAAVYHIE